MATSPPCFGQASSTQSRDRRLEAAEADVSLLKRLVREQDRRIAELEKIGKSFQTTQTLVYKGDVAGSGIASGVVKLTDDRVSQISPPNF